MTDQLTLDELTTWMAQSVGLDEALFAMIGEWSVDEPVTAHRVVYATVSRWFGEHAVAMRSLLPDSPSLAAPDRVVLPGDWAERLGESSPPGDRRASFQRIVSDRLDRDERVRKRLDPLADGPLLRHLAHTRLDLQAAQGLLDAQ
jgi:hypothetical protein